MLFTGFRSKMSRRALNNFPLNKFMISTHIERRKLGELIGSTCDARMDYPFVSNWEGAWRGNRNVIIFL